MRAELTRVIGVAALASALAGCGADTPALVRFERARATLHPAADAADGWVVDGTVDLVVLARDDETETWLMSLFLHTREDPSRSELSDVTAEPLSSFPLHTPTNSYSIGTLRFHGTYPSFAWKEGDCASGPALWVSGTYYDTSSLDDRGANFGSYLAEVRPELATLTCEP